MDIKKETYIDLPTENKLDVLFDIVLENNKKIVELEKKMSWSKIIPGITGAATAFALDCAPLVLPFKDTNPTGR